MPKLETITLIHGTNKQSGADSDAGFRLIISKQGLDVRKEIPRSHRTSKADEGGRPYRQGHCEAVGIDLGGASECISASPSFVVATKSTVADLARRMLSSD